MRHLTDIAVATALLGLIAGWFASMVIHRVPRRRAVLHPAPYCPRCTHPLALRDQIPVVGWVLLGGRCRYCREPISLRYPIVELVMAVLWAAIVLGFGHRHAAVIPALLAVCFYCVTLGAIDAATRLLPNRLTYAAFPTVLGLLTVASVAEGDFSKLWRALVASAVATAVFALLALTAPGSMGLGDVKFASTLALALGWLGWDAVVGGFVVAFLLGGLGGIVAIVAMHRTRRDSLPFGPWLAIATLIVILAASPLGAWLARGGLGS